MSQKLPYPDPFSLVLLLILFNWGIYSLISTEMVISNLSGLKHQEFKSLFPTFYELLFFCAGYPVIVFSLIGITCLAGNFFLLKRILFFMRNKHLIVSKEYLLALGSLTITLLVLEAVLRFAGYRPDEIGKAKWFTPVHNLEVYEGFYGDSIGHFKATPKAIETVSNEINNYFSNNSTTEYDRLEKGWYSEPYSLKKDFLDILFSKVENDLQKKFASIKKKSPAERSGLDSAILSYIFSPLNQDGFKSIPFTSFEGNQKKVLLLGDSFTWGHSAKPLTNSFADILLARDLFVFNTGVSGTDPAYYHSLAEYYIPKLRPDVVIVNFYLGNDVQYYEKELKPGIPAFFPTNAGNLISCINGIYFDDPIELYDLKTEKGTPYYRDKIGQTLIGNTVIGALLLNSFDLAGKIGYSTSILPEGKIEEAKKLELPFPNANEKCARIKELTEASGAKFILSVIPALEKTRFTTVSDYQGLFTRLDFVTCPSLSKNDYHKKDGHFNNEGNRKYAEFLFSLIEDR